MTRAVCTIQRYLRGYLGRKRAAYLREKKQVSQGGHVQGKVLGSVCARASTERERSCELGAELY